MFNLNIDILQVNSEKIPRIGYELHPQCRRSESLEHGTPTDYSFQATVCGKFLRMTSIPNVTSAPSSRTSHIRSPKDKTEPQASSACRTSILLHRSPMASLRLTASPHNHPTVSKPSPHGIIRRLPFTRAVNFMRDRRESERSTN